MGTPLGTIFGTIFTTVCQVIADCLHFQRGGFNTEYNAKNAFLPFFANLKHLDKKNTTESAHGSRPLGLCLKLRNSHNLFF